MVKATSFATVERRRAAAWRLATSSLPDGAWVPAAYVTDGKSQGGPQPFCLPAEFASCSLLPDVRRDALQLFAELGIPWHAGINGGPSNHLLDSQVQCVNALFKMVSDPLALRRAFGLVLGTAEVLEVEPDRYLTFEYIGENDLLGEGRGRPRVRGSKCTSTDAAFLHRTDEGIVELVLVEWKYTESYVRRQPNPAKDAVRRQTYEHLVADPEGPVRGELLDFDELLQEPLYQLVRQQLLAHELEKAHAHRADRVRVVNIAPVANWAYQQSIFGSGALALGATVSQVWSRLQRRPDRFVSLDSSRFLDHQITSAEYDLRYGDHLARDDGELAQLCGGDVTDHLDALEFEGDFNTSSDSDDVDDGHVEVYLRGRATWLEYPFNVRDLETVADALTVEMADVE